MLQPRRVVTGYAGVRVTGPPGAGVLVAEQVGKSMKVLAGVHLSRAGVGTISRALRWRCDRRVRHLVAGSLPPVTALAHIVVSTPPCAGRLVVRLPRSGRAGSTLRVTVRDRWAFGGLALRACVTPPGAAPLCRRWEIPAGRATSDLPIATPRPGRWVLWVANPYSPPAREEVWVAHRNGRLLLLAAGDSEMQILGDDIAQDVQPSGVTVVQDARISTGLTNSFYFDWQAHGRTVAAALRPDVTVMFIGANEGFPVAGARGRPVNCCGRGWISGYGNLVARMMGTFLRGSAGRVYWFVLPTPRPPDFKNVFDAVNAGIREAAARYPGRVGLIDANRIFTPGDRYRDYMIIDGRGLVIHEPDGIHLSASSDRIAARLLAGALRRDGLLR